MPVAEAGTQHVSIREGARALTCRMLGGMTEMLYTRAMARMSERQYGWLTPIRSVTFPSRSWKYARGPNTPKRSRRSPRPGTLRTGHRCWMLCGQMCSAMRKVVPLTHRCVTPRRSTRRSKSSSGISFTPNVLKSSMSYHLPRVGGGPR